MDSEPTNARPLPAATPGTIDVDDVSLKAGLRACKRCGCIGLITFPCKAQWSIDQVWLAYRCGGSAGIVEERDLKDGRFLIFAIMSDRKKQRTGFPFHPIESIRHLRRRAVYMIGIRDSGFGIRDSDLGE